jgi:SAM-dependent methyltransferase
VVAEPGQAWASAEAAEAWRRGAERRRQALGPATQRLLDLANVRTGSRVLDLAAGTGEQSLLAAQRVGPEGLVLATDISGSMLEVAERTAREAGWENVQTRVMDAAAIDLDAQPAFDAAICRLGLMFVSDLGAGLRGVLQVLEPGARLGAMVWSAPERNPLLSLPDGIADRLGWPEAPRRTLHRALSLGDPEALSAALRGAGFRDVGVEPVAAPRAFGSAAEAVGYSRNDSPVWRELVGSVPESEAEAFWRQVEAAFRRFESPSGCVLPGEVLVASGARPDRV